MLEEIIMTNQTKNGELLYANTSDFPAIVVVTCMLSVFSIVGTTGNAFVLYVFSKKKDKTTSTVFILALALIDFVTCLFLIPSTIVVEYLYKKIDNDALCKIYQFFMTSNVPLSAFIMTAIAFDRYVCICRPWLKFLNINFAKKTIFALLIICLILGLITSLAYGVYHQRHVVLNQSEFDNRVFNFVDNVTNESTSNNQSKIKFQQKLEFSPDCSRNISDTSSAAEFPNNDMCLRLQKTTKMFFTNESSTDEINFYFTGYCYPNEKILSRQFRKAYQTFYASLFLLVFLLVFVLYALILRSILVRRSKRLKASIAYRSKNARYYHSGSRRRKTPKETSKHPLNTHSEQPATGNAVVLKYCSDETKTVEDTTAIINKNGFANVRYDKYKSVQISNEVIKDECKTTSSTAGTKPDDTRNDTSIREHAVNYSTNDRRRFHKKKRFSDEKQANSKLIGTIEDNCSDIEIFRIIPNNICRHDTRKSIRERLRLANIKTAGILFTVTLVFIIAFLPAWLMAVRLLSPPNMIVFYMYFIYNVANPFIYAFFNQTFQKEMKTVLKCSNLRY